MGGMFEDDCANESATPSTAGMYDISCITAEPSNQGFFQADTCAPVDPCFSRGSFFIEYCDQDGCIPYVPPGGPAPQECLPYDCSALETLLLSIAPDTTIAYGIGLSDTTYPFATTRPGTWGAPDKFSAWSAWITGANQLTDWGTYPGLSDVTGVSWYGDLQKLQFCPVGGEAEVPTHIAEFEANGSVTAVTIPTRFIGVDAPRTDGSTTALVTGFRGQALGTLNLVNNQVGRIVLVENDVPIQSHQIQVYASFTNTGLILGCGSGGGGDSGEIDFGEALVGQWLYVTQTATARGEFGFPNANPTFLNYRTIVQQTVTMTRGDTGETRSATVEGFEETPYTYLDGKERTLDPWYQNSFYDAPYLFRGNSTANKVSWAFLSHGDSIGHDHTELHTAFKRSFVDYTPPESCPA